MRKDYVMAWAGQIQEQVVQSDPQKAEINRNLRGPMHDL